MEVVTSTERGQPARRACTFCQNRHLKCDGIQPCHQCERRNKECVFATPSHSKRTSTKKIDEESNLSLDGFGSSSQHSKWSKTSSIKDDPSAEGAVFALDGEDGDMSMDGPSSFKRKKRKPNGASLHYMEEDEESMMKSEQMDSTRGAPPRFALPAAAALLTQATAPSNQGLSHVMLGNGSKLSDAAMDATAALSQLSNSASMHQPSFMGFSTSNTNKSNNQVNSLNNQTNNTGNQNSHLSIQQPTFLQSNQQQQQQQQQQQNNNLSSANSKTIAITNAWMIAFSQGVSPFTSSAPFSPLDAVELQRILALDTEQLNNLAPEVIARALMQCAMLAHGSRYTGNLDTAAVHGWKGWQLVKVAVGKKRAHTVPALAQTIVSGIELLVYFFMGTSDFFKVRALCSQAYHILVYHRKHLTDATAHRILGLQIGASCNLDDIEFWLGKAKALNLQATTHFETSGWVFLALMLSTTLLGAADRDVLPIRPKSLSEREFTHKIAVLQVIDESEKAVIFFEATPQCATDPNSLKVCKVHKAILNGCRALILWQCGFEPEAVAYVGKVLNAGKPLDTIRLPHLIILCCVAQISRCLNQRPFYTKALEFIEEGLCQYSWIRSMFEELKKPVSLPDGATLPEDGELNTPTDESSSSSTQWSNQSNQKATSPFFANRVLSKTDSPLTRTSSLFSRQQAGSPSLGPTLMHGSKPVTANFDSAVSPRGDEETQISQLPMRPNPMKALLHRAPVAGQSISPAMQSVSPQLSMSPQLHGLQSVSPHLLQGVSPLTQGLSPFTTLPTPLMQPHLMQHLQQFSPQLGGFLGVGGQLNSTFSPGQTQSTSPSWVGTSLSNEYMMDTGEHQLWS